MAFSRILIAVDGSAESIDAARKGLELAAALSAHVATIYVVEPAVDYSSEAGIPPAELLQVANRDDDAVASALRRAVRIPDDAVHHVRVGQPADAIVDLANDWPADLIVVGSRGRSGIGRVLLGSVAESVVRRAPCPVLVVRKSGQPAK